MMRIFLVLILLVAILVFPGNALAAFSTPISLTPEGVGVFPSVDAGSGGVIHVVWAEFILDGTFNKEIFYSKSTDNGVTFPEANKRNVSNTSLLVSTKPKLKLDSNNDIHIVWQEHTDSSAETEVMYVKSSDNGGTFSTPLNISNDSVVSASPFVETSGANRVYVAWMKEEGNFIQIFLARSSNGGNSFGTGVNVSNTSHFSGDPVIASKGGKVVVAWPSEGDESGAGFGIYRVFSSDNGDTFGSALNLSAGTTERVTRPRMAFDGVDRLHVVAQRFIPGLDKEIDYYRSTNEGQTFDTAVNLSNSPSLRSFFPVVRTVGDDTVKVSWNEDVCTPTCTTATLEAESINGGLSFGAAGSTEFTTPTVEDVDFDVIGSTLHIVYQDGNTVWYKKGSRS